jgi:hypothetical protein
MTVFTQEKKYEGIAQQIPGKYVRTGATGLIDQNTNGSQANAFNSGKATIGAAAVERAIFSGYTVDQIQEWVNRVGATVGPEAQTKYKLVSTV